MSLLMKISLLFFVIFLSYSKIALRLVSCGVKMLAARLLTAEQT